MALLLLCLKQKLKEEQLVNWKDTYKGRLMTAQEAAKIVQSGDDLWIPLLLGQPSVPTMDAIADRKDELKDVEFFSVYTLWPYKIFQPEYREAFKLIFGMYSPMPHMQALAKSEWANYWPVQSSDAGSKYSQRKRVRNRRTGIVTQVTPPDEEGYVNLGLENFFTEDILNLSEWAIAEVNPQMPRTYGQTQVHVSRFNAFVENSTPILAIPTPQPTDVEIMMAENVMSLLQDRDCIQVGIGAVPAMISKLLERSGLKDIGIHSEMAPAGTPDLVEKGIVTGKYKKVNPGKIIISFTAGDRELYDFLGNNPMVEFYSTAYTCNPCVIAAEDNVVAINGSIEVDLTGQVMSEAIGNVMRGGIGGQLDFVIGASMSKGGKAINLVPSTGGKDDSISRIVPFIGNTARISVPRQYVGYIVTEYGIANLRTLSENERAEALIKIAHPKFREDLEKAGRERNLIHKKIF